MNERSPAIETADVPLPELPETQRELELLLEALHALNDALDEYEAQQTSAPAPESQPADQLPFAT
jgi:hypothetical protein